MIYDDWYEVRPTRAVNELVTFCKNTECDECLFYDGECCKVQMPRTWKIGGGN